MDNQLEAIVILGGGLMKNPDGTFRTTNFNERGDNSGILGDRLRVEAANYLYQKNTNRMIIASGGQGLFKNIEVHPNISAVIKKELIEQGVPGEKIIEENSSNNTYQQLKGLIKIFNESKIKKVIIITNRWHLPRTRTMMKYKDDLKELKKLANIKLISAEEIVIKHNKKKWQKIINNAYKSQIMREGAELEKEGLRQIKKGTYRYE